MPPAISTHAIDINIEVRSSLVVVDNQILASAQKTGNANAETASCVARESIKNRAKVMVASTPVKPQRKNNAKL